ncbi:MAG: response regulator transcription factor [Myxococcales bacterium]|nr:response regulator transcription factor [Myxococcales bacterium]MCB9751946.1 response regulator transcription factor [Myxococcales bacterium]
MAIIDDDPSVRAFLEAALREQDYQVMSFATAEAYLASPRARAPSCLIVDLQLPGMDGEQLFRALRDDDRSIPVIFMSGYGTVSIATRLMKEGAVYFLEKPVRLQELERFVGEALALARRRDELDELRRRLDSLTPREHEILNLVIKGMSSRQIATALSRSEPTIQLHRAHIMKKLDVRGVANLVRLVTRAQSASVPNERPRVGPS